MKKRHTGLKVLVVTLSLFMVFPYSIVSAAAAKAEAKVKHKSPEYYIPGFRIILDTEVEDGAGVLVARCYFKTKKDKNFVFVDMLPKGNPEYQATLPAPWVGSEYIEYVFVVVSKKKEVFRTQMFKMEERETAAASSWKEASEVKEIRLDKAQEVLEKYDAVKKALREEFKNKLPKWQTIEDQGELGVFTEFESPLEQVKGFYDNFTVTTVSSSSKYGVMAEGLYTDSEIAAIGGKTATASATGASTAGTISATAGGISTGMVVLGVAAVAGVAAAAGSSSGDDDAVAGGGLVAYTSPAAQSAPYGIEIIAHDAVSVPMSVTYNGTALPAYAGTGTVNIDLTGIFTIGGVMRLTLTSDVAAPGAGREFHFNSGGGRQPGPGIPYQIIGPAGSYILLTTR